MLKVQIAKVRWRWEPPGFGGTRSWGPSGEFNFRGSLPLVWDMMRPDGSDGHVLYTFKLLRRSPRRVKRVKPS